MKSYEGGMLDGIWDFYIKVDGINLTKSMGTFRTRAGNIVSITHADCLSIPDGVYELFLGDWGSSSSLKSRPEEIRRNHLFNLKHDSRLYLRTFQNPSDNLIDFWLKYIVSRGHEGLVLQQGRNELKVKPFVTPDVRVTGIKWGTGRNEGRVGSLLTNWGNVQLQKDEDKEAFKDGSVIGKIVEVKCMGWTSGDKMRHARFLRLREDKLTENLERVEDKYGS